MSLSDFIIIYLACGAPFGVCYYFNNKGADKVFIKSFVNALFWIFFLYQFVRNKFTKDSADSERTSDIRIFQKKIERLLPEHLSIFVFREIIERYIGLTLAEQNFPIDSPKSDNSFAFQFCTQNEQLAARCLNRNEYKKLKAHQIYARRDFLKIICFISDQTTESIKFLNAGKDFAALLNDRTAVLEIEKYIISFERENQQNITQRADLELWKPEKINLPAVK